jgi:hypothetical protein
MGTDDILKVLTGFYTRGQLDCNNDVLHIAFDVRTEEIRLRGPGSADERIRFPEKAFRDMVENTSVPTTATLICLWLCAIYYDPGAYPWVRRD